MISIKVRKSSILLITIKKIAMKNLVKISSLLLFSFLTISNVIAQEEIYVTFDEAYMDRYQYEVQGLSAYKYHNAYHVQTPNKDMFILNTSMQSFDVLKPSTTITPINEINWYTTLLNEVNLGLTELYIVDKINGTSYAYRVSTAIFVKESNTQVMYAGPYYSFTYEKQKAYAVNENILAGEFIIHDEANFVNNAEASKTACLDKFSFKKTTFERFPKESYTMLATTDFIGVLTEDSVISRPRTTYIDFVDNIGIVEERTALGSIKLIGINGEKLSSYISRLCSPEEYNTPVVETIPAYQPKSVKSNLTIPAPSNVNTKSAVVTKPVGQFNEKGAATASSPKVESEYELLYDLTGNQNNKHLFTSKGEVVDAVVHVVDNGETLYGISRKYGVSIADIQKLNNLEGTDIKVTQTLVIKK